MTWLTRARCIVTKYLYTVCFCSKSHLNLKLSDHDEYSNLPFGLDFVEVLVEILDLFEDLFSRQMVDVERLSSLGENLLLSLSFATAGSLKKNLKFFVEIIEENSKKIKSKKAKLQEIVNFSHLKS